jgi:hypothetical protein
MTSPGIQNGMNCRSPSAAHARSRVALPRPARVVAHFLSFLVAWPLWSVMWGPGILVATPLFAAADPWVLWWGAAVTALEMWREFAVVGLLLALLTTTTVVVAGVGGVREPSAGKALAAGVGDVAAVGLALLLGVALELPAALGHRRCNGCRLIPCGS